jgi:hypothetical protein
MPMMEVVPTDTHLQISAKKGVEFNPLEELAMKRLIASVALAMALLTSGAVVTQSSLVGTAYADDGGGAD